MKDKKLFLGLLAVVLGVSGVCIAAGLCSDALSDSQKKLAYIPARAVPHIYFTDTTKLTLDLLGEIKVIIDEDTFLAKFDVYQSWSGDILVQHKNAHPLLDAVNLTVEVVEQEDGSYFIERAFNPSFTVN